jgi:N-acetylmuramoyl-L-alanine amidase
VRICALRPATLATAVISALALSLTTLSALAGTLNPVKLWVSGKEVALKFPAVYDGNEVYLPLDALSAFGVTYSVTRREETAVLTLPNGLKTEVALARPGNAPMLPLSSVAHTLGIIAGVHDGVCEVRRPGERLPAEPVRTSTERGSRADQVAKAVVTPEKKPVVEVPSGPKATEKPMVKPPAESKIHLDLPTPKFGAQGANVQNPGGVDNGKAGDGNDDEDQPDNTHPNPPTGPGTLASRGTVNPLVIPPRPAVGGVRIEGVDFEAAGDNAAHIRFKTIGRVTPTTRLLTEPSRLAIDIPNSALENDKRDWEVEHKFLTAIHAVDGEKPGITRFVLDLSRLVTYRLLPSESDGFTLNLGVPRGSNREVSDLTIVVDAGHGGSSGTNPVGCSIVSGGTCIMEKNLTLSIAKRVQRLLEEEGATVVMTRTSDTSLKLQDRPAIAVRNNADMFISIHIDDCPRPNSASGTTAYYSNVDPNGRALAQSIVTNIAAVSGLPNRRARSDRERFSGTGMAVLHTGPIPSTLVEIGYINNATDRAKLINPGFQDTIARAFLDGIRGYVTGTLAERVAGPVVPVATASMH